MAVNYSFKELVFAKRNAISKLYPSSDKFIYKLFAKILDFYFIIKVKLINFSKNISILYDKKKIYSKKLSENDIKINLQPTKSFEFNNKSWCFIENFVDQESYSIIKNSWPSDKNFYLNNSPIKYYYIHNIIYSENDLEKIENENIKIFSRLILSKKFSDLIKEFSNDKNDYNLKNIVYSVAGNKSYLIPHTDSVSKNTNYHKTLNFIFFVEGNDNCIEHSGGTGIYKDNEFNKPIFIPTTLNNSCLIYDSSENFFHGFKKMKPEGYRKAITFSFMSDK